MLPHPLNFNIRNLSEQSF